MGTDPEGILINIIVIVLSITLHEFGHAISADRLGDPGPRRDGRVTLWPDKHFDIFGFIFIVVTQFFGVGIGWGKPVMVNSRYFKNPRMGMLIVAAFGPLMNLLLAVVAGLILRGMVASGMSLAPTVPLRFVQSFLLLNLSLMFFNLIPIHPLDGGKILSGLLPEDMARSFDEFMWQWGPRLLMLLIILGRNLLGNVMEPAIITTASLITGLQFG